MLDAWREPWWRSVLVGTILTLIFLSFGAWQLTVVAAGVAGFLGGKGRTGAARGIQAVGPAWFLWLAALSLFYPMAGLAVLLGDILGAGWGLVVLLAALVPGLLGMFGGLAGGYLSELLAPREALVVPPPSGPAP